MNPAPTLAPIPTRQQQEGKQHTTCRHLIRKHCLPIHQRDHILSQMRRLSISGDELPRFDVRDVADGPDVLCAFDAQEGIDHDGAGGVEEGGGHVGGVGE